MQSIGLPLTFSTPVYRKIDRNYQRPRDVCCLAVLYSRDMVDTEASASLECSVQPIDRPQEPPGN